MSYQSRKTTRKGRSRPTVTPLHPQRHQGRAVALVVGLVVIAAIYLIIHQGGIALPGPIASPTSHQSSAGPRQIVPPASLFSPGVASGACMEYGPLRHDQHRVVFVDPGHGGADPGASGTTSAGVTIHEKDLTLAIALDLLPLLRQDGYTVVLSRNADTLVTRLQPGDQKGKLLTDAGLHRDVEARVACANAANANVLLAIHFNAFADPTVNGDETLYDSARPFAAANRRLALLVQADTVNQMRAAGWAVPDRGILNDIAAGTPSLSTEAAAYGHLLELGPAAAGWLPHPSTMPGALAEPLFLTHPAEADVAASAHGQQVIASGLAQAITTFLAPPATKRG